MTDSSTAQATGMTEADAAATLFARYQSDADQGDGETGEQSPTEDEDDAEGQPDAEADAEDQSDEQDEDTEEAEPAKTFRVKIDGEEVEVTEDELLRGYSREQDYTRKTQALAEDRKAVQAEKQAAAEARDQYSRHLETVAQIIEANQPRVDQSLRDTNPAEWSAQMLQHRQWAEQRQAVSAEKERAEREAAQQAEAERLAFVREQQAKLPELIPEWRDTKVAEAESAKLYGYGVQQGYDPSEMDEVVDSRAVAILRKAMLFDELMAKKPTVQNRIQEVKTLRPGSAQAPSRNTEERRARERLATDGSTDAAVALILARSNRRA